MTNIALADAKSDLEALIARAAAGEEIVIVENGKPRARLVAPAQEVRSWEEIVQAWPQRRQDLGLPPVSLDDIKSWIREGRE